MSKDFEQAAKKQGDDFSLQPRDQVWLRIEAALDEKKRRGIAWWVWAFPLALLLGSGLGYYFYNPATNTGVAASRQTDKVKEDGKKSVKESTTIVNNEPVLSPSSIATHTPNDQTTQKGKKRSKAETARGSEQEQLHTASITRTPVDPKGNTVGHESNPPDSKSIVPVPVPTTPVSTSTGAPETPQAIAGTSDDKSSGAFSSQPIIANSGSGTVPAPAGAVAASQPASEMPSATEPKTLDATEPTETTAKIVIVDSSLEEATFKKSGINPATVKKAAWFVQAGIGKSYMGAFDILPGGEKAFASDPLQAGTGNAVSTQSKSDEPGIAFSLALQRRQNLGKRWQWQASLGWQQQQVKQYRGNKVDSMIVLEASRYLSNSFFYQPGSNSSVKGTNNRLMVSNDFAWQVLKNKSWLRLSGGLYTGFNISNNYYVRDNAQRMVKNDGLYSNWFIGFTPGIELSYKNKLTLGAYSHFDFTKAYDELNSIPQYWRGWEIRAGISLFNK